MAAEPAGPVARFPAPGVGPRGDSRVYADRLVRVLAEGLRTIEERRTREQTESRNRAIIVPLHDGGTKR